MSTFARFSALFALSISSAVLFACGSDASAPPAFETAATAQPLVEACQGAFTCTFSDSPRVSTTLTLTKNGAECTTDKNDVFTATHRWLRDDADGKQNDHGSWAGDSHAFDICDPVDCYHCTNDAVVAGGGNTGDQGSRCTGRTSCEDFGAGDCGTHQGCNLHGHAVYSFGMFDHYEDECQGSTPSCSSHTIEQECKRQDCTWK